MRKPRFTDTANFKMAYKRAAFSRAPGYLRRRFDAIAPGWRKQQGSAK